MPKLRPVVLTSLPALSCQSPLPRSKRLALFPWAASVPGAESKKTQVYHVYPTLGKQLVLRERALSGRFLSLYAIEFISRLAFSVFVCHRCCRIAFLGRDVCSLFFLGAVCLVWFSSWFLCSVLRKCVYSGHFLYLGLPSMSYCLSPAWNDFIGGACRLNQSINQSTLPFIFLFECSVEPPPAGDLRFVRDREKTCACTRLRGSRKPSAESVVERAETTRDSLLKPFPCLPVQIYMPRAGHFYLWRY